MILAACLTIAMAKLADSPPNLGPYNVVWTTPSKDASGSMPVGNGETVLNAWVEQETGDILFYIARTDALSEISRYLKLGRVRVHFDPNPFKNAKEFQQQVRLNQGLIGFHAELDHESAGLLLYVDSEENLIRLWGTLPDVSVTATVESWRDKPRTLPKEEQHSAWSVHDAPFPLEESADRFLGLDDDAVVWCHRNETSVVPKIWENQSLTGLPGTFDPILHRTFGGLMRAEGLVRKGERTLVSSKPVRSLDLTIATHSAQTPTLEKWISGLRSIGRGVDRKESILRTTRWWQQFWDRSWVIAETPRSHKPPANDFPVRQGVDSNGSNRFPGEIERWEFHDRVLSAAEIDGRFKSTQAWQRPPENLRGDFTLIAAIKPETLSPGRIFDNLTAGKTDGVLFDTHPGDSLRLIVGSLELSAAHCLKAGVWQRVAATYNADDGEAAIYLDGVCVAHRPAETVSPITRAYILQRYVQACQGRGAYPIKFNGGFYTVEPAAMGKPFNADWRNWGDCHWYQNVRHMYHPMLASGDFEMMEPFFRLYESARPLAESRTKLYHGAQGAYFPETMTIFGTYSAGDYGWDRTGHEPKEVLCPCWDDAWNQGPELVALMLDRWDYTRDERFLKQRVLPMAESVLRYFDTRFKKDALGRIILDPTQVVETYWEGVVNDMPCAAGLIAVSRRLSALPNRLVGSKRKAFFERIKAACPELPIEEVDGLPQLAPAQKYAPKTSNVENGELYAVWPFRVVSLSNDRLLDEARRAYAHRKNRLDVGWGYDGNVAALLGMTDEAARILQIKCANSNPAYRWPATWGPNFDWLPDQNHGGNLLETTQLMLLQADPIEQGGAIRVLPAWPAQWPVRFKLHAPGNTVVECSARDGKIKVSVTPPKRAKDLVLPRGWQRG